MRKHKLLRKLKKILKKKKSRKRGINRSKNRGKYKKWRRAVFSRDKYKCQKCTDGKPLNAHHIRPWALFPLDRYRITNGVTLCEACHAWVHNPDNKDRTFLDLGKYD